ncbi:MAG: hypothetical protein ACTSR1_01025 [Candidatus Heimdallarchaeota archaeon]
MVALQGEAQQLGLPSIKIKMKKTKKQIKRIRRRRNYLVEQAEGNTVYCIKHRVTLRPTDVHIKRCYNVEGDYCRYITYLISPATRGRKGLLPDSDC